MHSVKLGFVAVAMLLGSTSAFAGNSDHHGQSGQSGAGSAAVVVVVAGNGNGNANGNFNGLNGSFNGGNGNFNGGNGGKATTTATPGAAITITKSSNASLLHRGRLSWRPYFFTAGRQHSHSLFVSRESHDREREGIVLLSDFA